MSGNSVNVRRKYQLKSSRTAKSHLIWRHTCIEVAKISLQMQVSLLRLTHDVWGSISSRQFNLTHALVSNNLKRERWEQLRKLTPHCGIISIIDFVGSSANAGAASAGEIKTAAMTVVKAARRFVTVVHFMIPGTWTEFQSRIDEKLVWN